MIVTMYDKRRRFPRFQVWRLRGKRPAQYYLMLDRQWHLPFQHNGDLAMTGPSWRACYEVSFSRLPVEIQISVRRCIRRILDTGTPIERDESVFGGLTDDR